MSLWQFLSILRARWLMAVFVWAAVLAVVMAVTLMRAKQYEATASIVIDVRPDPLSAVALGPALSQTVVATQVDIIQSERVARRVVKDLNLVENPAVREQWATDGKGEGTVENWLVDTFQRNLDVRPSRESNVIQISYSAPDANFAAAMANAFSKAYLDVSVELRTGPARQFSDFFDQRAKDARDGLEKAQARLSEFQKSNGIIASDERLDVESARLSELSSQLVALQAVASESRSRLSQANQGASDRHPDVINNGMIAALRADMSRQEARLQELGARLGDANPQVIELRASIAEMRQRVEAETRRVTGSVGISNNINNQRESQTRSELEAQRGKLLRLKAVRDQGSVLMRDVENAQRTYETLVARLNQTSLESQATQSNANVLTQANPPLKPSKPRVLVNAGLGAFLGVLLGVGLAIVMELLDRRVRVVEDLKAALGVPVLGVMPAPGGRMLQGWRRAPLMERRLLGSPAGGKR